MKCILFVVMKCFRHNMHPIQTIQGSQNTQALQYFTTINSSGKNPLVLSQPSLMIWEIVNYVSPSACRARVWSRVMMGQKGYALLTYLHTTCVLSCLYYRTGQDNTLLDIQISPPRTILSHTDKISSSKITTMIFCQRCRLLF